MTESARCGREDDSAVPELNNGAAPWIVLVVDDEPEIHAVTRMVLSHAEFHGAPVQLHSAYSAGEARQFLEAEQDLALILLDVVMETDDAGLRLCRFVREELQNDDVQIVLRTGQPGQAPEREVILHYGINGYFLKTEITAQKLHSILISSLRTYNYIRALKTPGAGLVRAERASPRICRPGIEKALRAALSNDELSLVAEPQVDLRTGAVVGVELFARWCADEYADVLPEEVTAVTEQWDLSIALSEWTLSRAYAVTEQWRSAGLGPLRIAVNVCLAQFERGGLVEIVRRCLAESRLAPEYLELEVPETALTAELQAGGGTLHALRALGVGIAVDKCGVGVASLSQLKRLQPDRLKIDQSLVQAMISDPDDAAVARAIIALAHTMQMSVVAEGVETKEQVEFLKWEECEVAQGRYFCSAMPTAHIPELLRARDARIQ